MFLCRGVLVARRTGCRRRELRPRDALIVEASTIPSTGRGGRWLSRHRAWLVPFLMLVLLAPWSATTASAAQRTVRVGLYEIEPKLFTDADGKPAGIFADLLEEIAKEEGWTLEWVPGTWDEGLARLASGEIDVMPDVARTSERDTVYDFHVVPVVENWSYVYAAPGVHVERWSDLTGKRVAVLENTIQEQVFRQMVEGFGYDIQIVRVASLKEAFQSAADRKTDAAIANHLFGDYFYPAYGLSKTPLVINQVPMYFAVRKGANSDLLKAIDLHLAAWLKQPGSVYYQTLDRYLAKERPAGLPVWVPWTVGGTLAALAAAFGLIALLRWQVSLRTRDLRDANAAVAKAEETLRLAVDAAEDGIFDWNPKTGSLYWAPRNYEMLGYERDEFPTDFETWASRIHPDDRDRVIREELEHITDGDRSFNVEYRLRKKSGDWMWTASRGRAVEFDDEDEPTRVVGRNTDITDRKRTEQEIRDLNMQLEARVAERTAQLSAANKELESFSYSVSHDLRAPLRAISGFSQIIARRHRQDLNDEGRHYVDNVVQAAERMGQLIDDLLTYSRLGRQAVEIQEVPLSELAADLTTEFAARFEEAGGTLEWAQDLPVVRGDRTLIARILTNLVENGFTYRSPGAAPHVKVGWADDADAIVLSVADDGIGIPEEYQDKVFNIFQRLHGEDEYPGTGIGLANVKKCAEMLGGSVWLTSKPGEGSTFFVRLPKGS